MKKNNQDLQIVSRYTKILSQITRFTKNNQRPEVVVVTKNQSDSLIKQFLESVKHPVLGENRVGEALSKIESFRDYNPTWHYIGHLQRNKVKKIIGKFSLIQSLSSVPLAEEIEKRAKLQEKKVNCLVQIDICEDGTKFGFPPEVSVLKELLSQFSNLNNIRIRGLMTIAPYVTPEETRPYFKRMSSLFDTLRTSCIKYKNISMDILSMGMSNDYIIALEEGSTMIRVGSAIFE
ncbi:MAG: YggS family pyridoxal phosphate-dependent enzyme [Candidatus Hodarchaeales archaeon]